MEPLTDAQRRAVLTEFLDRTQDGKGLLPAPKPFPYDPVPAIERAHRRAIDHEVVAQELVAPARRKIRPSLLIF